MRITAILAVLAALCGSAEAAQGRPIGGQRDRHGCLGPAGYSWCARERSCVRIWELARQLSVADPKDAARYCASRGRPQFRSSAGPLPR
jgi:hypothetical protein